MSELRPDHNGGSLGGVPILDQNQSKKLTSTWDYLGTYG